MTGSRPQWYNGIFLLSSFFCCRLLWGSYIMELIRLGNLNNEKRKKSFAVNEVLSILSQVLHALRYLHAQGYAHRDIKPANILIHSRNPIHVKLSDFGISQSTTALQTICGMIYYRAPELWTPNIVKKAKRSQPYTTAVDIWSLGAVALQLAYQQPPTSTSKSEHWPMKLHKAAWNLKPDPLIDLVRLRMLVMDPALRFSASDCIDEVSKIISRPITVKGKASTGATWGYPRRSDRLQST